MVFRDEILTVAEVAADLRCSKAHVYNMINGKVAGVLPIPAITMGRQRVYRGDIDSPKSVHSVRWAALSNGLLSAIQEWRQLSLDPAPEAWVFPSEKGTTPVLKDNCWRRHFAPQLKSVGLGWVNFHVMRRTHSCLLKELDVDPKVRADQMCHTVDVNENV